MSLIGQFGVGFYSAFMVADKVEVLSRKAGDSEGWRWISDGKGEFTIEPAADVRARHPHHAASARGRRRISRAARGCARSSSTYSDHIALPIVLADGNKEETINTASALWTRPRSEITPEQYKEFYHHVAHGFDEPWLTLHDRAEGVLEYTLPAVRPVDRSRSTCSTRSARRGSSSMSGASSSPTRAPSCCRPICVSCAASSTARTCRSTSAARCCNPTRWWRASASS